MVEGMVMLFVSFVVGLCIGCYAYDKGWRAQSPFYKVYSLDDLEPSWKKTKKGVDKTP
jgi:hypothetical protein